MSDVLAVRPGDRAPDFTLQASSGEEITLSVHHGTSNVLLAFFPLAFTPVCTSELCAFSDDFSQFAGAETVIYGISVDAAPSLKAFRATHNISVELLSDFRREVCRAYGTLLEPEFFSRRAYVIVDRDGIVRWTFVERELGHRRQNAELLAQIEALA